MVTDLDRAETLKEQAGDELPDSDVQTLIELLDSDDEEAQGVAAKALRSHSKDHAAELQEYATTIRSRVTDPDQDSTRQSYLGETISQIGLIDPEEVVPIAETLFEFTMKPWRFFSYTDALVAAAAEHNEVLEFLRSQTDSDSKPERNNAQYALSRVADDAPDRLTPYLQEFVDVINDDSEYLKIRGHAAKTYGLAATDSTSVRPAGDALATLLDSRESTAVKGALTALAPIIEHPSMELAPHRFEDRIEVLSDGGDPEIILFSEDKARVETVQEYLSEQTGTQTTANGGSETRVFNGSETTEQTATATQNQTADTSDSSSVSFCPNCGENLSQWSDPAFCSGCGFEFS